MSLKPTSQYVFPLFDGIYKPESGIVRFRISALALLLCGLAAAGWAQSSATLSGTVKDPTSAVVVQAVVSLTDTKTSAKKQTITNDAGAYSFTDLAPGDYTIEVSAPGF